MEQYIKELDTTGAEQRNVKFVQPKGRRNTSGQTKTISIFSSAKIGGNSALYVIVSGIKKDLVSTLLGIKGILEEKIGTTLWDFLKQVGIVVLRAVKKLDAVIVEQSFIPQRSLRNFAQSRVQCSKGLIYLIENKLITP